MTTRQRPFPRPEALIFDMDGTLFRTETLLVPAYERAFLRLGQEGLYQGEVPPVSIIMASLGMLLKEIWARVLPSSGPEVHARLDAIFLEEQLALLREGSGELYPDVEGTLHALRAAGFRLFVASNGHEAYVKGVAGEKHIAELFEGMYSAGEYGTGTKVDLVRLLLEHSGVRTAWMVGDRLSDVEAGKDNGLPVVGCDYAEFGVPSSELDQADMRIRSFAELLHIIAGSG